MWNQSWNHCTVALPLQICSLCVCGLVYERQEAIKHWSRCIWVHLCVCVSTVWPEKQTCRQSDRHQAKLCHRCLLNRAVITAQLSPVMWLSLYHSQSHTPQHHTTPHCAHPNAYHGPRLQTRLPLFLSFVACGALERIFEKQTVTAPFFKHSIAQLNLGSSVR